MSTGSEANFVQATGGSFGYWRGLAAGSTAFGDGTLLAAGEVVRLRRALGSAPTTCASSTASCATAQGSATTASPSPRMAYTNGAGTRPTRSRRAPSRRGLIGRFGDVDPTDGGDAQRYSLSARWRADRRERRHAASTPTSSSSTLNLFNNFTYFLDDPVNGDQFQQTDKRTILGAEREPPDCATGSAGASARPRSACRSATTTSASACSTPSQRAALDRARRPGERGQRRPLPSEQLTPWTDWLR